MKHFAEAIMIALCVMAMAYCSVQMNQSGNDYAMHKADVCIKAGGRYDFNWASCNYEAVK